jgi:hypothetical protein
MKTHKPAPLTKKRYALFAGLLFVFLFALRVVRDGMSVRAVAYAALTAVLATALMALMTKFRRSNATDEPSP